MSGNKCRLNIVCVEGSKFFQKTSGSSTVVEHLPRHPKVMGSSLGERKGPKYLTKIVN